MKQEKWTKYWLLIPLFTVLVALMLYPLMHAFYSSLISYLYGRAVNFVGLSNWFHTLSDKEFWASVLRTLVYSIIAIPIEVALALGLALLYVDLKGKLVGVMRTITIIPFMVMPVVAGIIWSLIFAPSFGLANQVLTAFGFDGINWLGDETFAVISVIVMDFWIWIPFVFLILLSGLQSMPNEPFEAAHVDGATVWQRFKNITLPLIRPVLLVAVILRTMDALRIFDQVYAMTRGGPGAATKFLSLHVGEVAFDQLNFGEASVQLFIIFIVMMLVIGLIYAMSGRNQV